MGGGIPHRKAAKGSGHGCNELKSSQDLRPLDYKTPARLPYPTNAPPSCNEIYDCDLVSSDPSRKYDGQGDKSAAVNMSPSQARQLTFLFRLQDNTPLDTVAKVKDVFCFDNDLQEITFNYDGKALRYVKVDGVDKNMIENHIPWVRELDDYIAEFIRV